MIKHPGRIKIASFYFLTCAVVLPPVLVAFSLIVVSALVYDTLYYPAKHHGSERVWVQLARKMYYFNTVNYWQTQRSCVRYDNHLLYVPSKGCTFINPEFSTRLIFSEDGRVIYSNFNKMGPPILVLGDSITMGWGVNNTETYSYLMGLSTSVPILNLGVSSYGTARELLRASRHSSFRDTKCLLIQYHWNDLEENQQYLTPKGIPPPTREQFQLLLEHRPKRLSFLQVLANTARYILRHPLDLYTDLIGRPRVWTNEEIFGYEPVNFRTHADYFLQVIGKFPEVRQKTVFVIAGAGISGEFASALLARPNRPTNVIPIEVDVGANFYTLDMHPNKFGHQKIAAQIIEEMKKSIEGRNCLGL